MEIASGPGVRSLPGAAGAVDRVGPRGFGVLPMLCFDTNLLVYAAIWSRAAVLIVLSYLRNLLPQDHAEFERDIITDFSPPAQELDSQFASDWEPSQLVDSVCGSKVCKDHSITGEGLALTEADKLRADAAVEGRLGRFEPPLAVGRQDTAQR